MNVQFGSKYKDRPTVHPYPDCITKRPSRVQRRKADYRHKRPSSTSVYGGLGGMDQVVKRIPII
jgi:hypothetical protein